MLNLPKLYVDYFHAFYQRADERCRAYYNNSTQPNGHAASLESLLAFMGFVRGRLGPMASIADAGAGVSSAILRARFSSVVTYDPDAEYLEQVRRTCTDIGLGHGEWRHGLPEYPTQSCFYDYGVKERIPELHKFADATTNIFWADDMNAADNHAALQDYARTISRALLRSSSSLDEYGRFSEYVIK